MGRLEVGFVERSTNRTSAELFLFIHMIRRGMTNFEKRYYGAFYNFQENNPREVKVAPDSSDFSFAI